MEEQIKTIFIMTEKQQAQYRAQMIKELVAQAKKNTESGILSLQIEDALALTNFVLVVVHNFGTSVGLNVIAMQYMHEAKQKLSTLSVFAQFDFDAFYRQTLIFAQRLENGEHI